MIFVKVKEKSIVGKGIGVFAQEFITKGTLIWKENNDVKKYSQDEYELLNEEIKKNVYFNGEFYVWTQGYGESWNHSCDANTWWIADDELSARRDIDEGEELTYDYATSDLDPKIEYTWECKCERPTCRKHLKWNDLISYEALYQEYKGHLPSYVENYLKDYRFKQSDI